MVHMPTLGLLRLGLVPMGDPILTPNVISTVIRRGGATFPRQSRQQARVQARMLAVRRPVVDISGVGTGTASCGRRRGTGRLASARTIIQRQQTAATTAAMCMRKVVGA